MDQTLSSRISQGLRSTIIGIIINLILCLVKGVAGVLGNSYALIADAIESLSDVFSSLIVFFGLKMASKPADKNHPYGHGKFEPLASVIVSMFLMGAVILISVESIHEIITPHSAPKPFTLIVLVGVVLVKEFLFRFVNKVSDDIKSSVVKADAWHHRSDAITSACAFIGISIALIGGKGYEKADDISALIAAVIILINALILLKAALFELVDTAPPAIDEQIRKIAESVPDVLGTHKCNVRKVGFSYYVDLDVLCNPDFTIRQGHEIAHNVGAEIHKLMPEITKILVHVEPVDDYGRRNMN